MNQSAERDPLKSAPRLSAAAQDPAWQDPAWQDSGWRPGLDGAADGDCEPGSPAGAQGQEEAVLEGAVRIFTFGLDDGRCRQVRVMGLRLVRRTCVRHDRVS